MRYTTITAPFDNGRFTFIEFPFWLDGTPLSDKKNADVFDDILFAKRTISGKVYYYKRYTESASFNIQDWGVMPGNKPDVNSANVEKLIGYFPQGYAANIHVPVGDYGFNKSIVLDGKPFKIVGVNGTAFAQYTSKFTFVEPVTGIMVKRQKSNHQETILEDLYLRAAGNKSTPWCSGVNSNGRIRLKRITAENFSHNGIDLWGNLDEGGDVSGSYIENCHALENGKDGFFTGRSDGNAVTHIGCDARDNGRHGFNDDSFLGNHYYSCMAHYNPEGDFLIRDWENARGLFMGCYSEGGNKKPSYFGDKTTVIGGIWGTGFVIMGQGPQRRASYIPLV